MKRRAKMSKELDALRELKYVHDTKCGEDKSVNEKFTLIETTLEALQYIEEELRIDFITLFKALKQGNIWVREHNTEEKEIVYGTLVSVISTLDVNPETKAKLSRENVEIMLDLYFTVFTFSQYTPRLCKRI